MPASNAAVPAPARRRFAHLSLIVLFALLAQLLAPLAAPPAVRAAEPPPPTTLSGSPPPATLGEPYAYRFQLGGDPQATVTVDSGSLPLGLSLAPDGTLSGTPLNGGTYGFTLWAGTEAGVTATLPVILDVQMPVVTEPVAAPQPNTADQAPAQPVGAAATPEQLTSAEPESLWAARFAAAGRGIAAFFGAIVAFLTPAVAAAEPPQGAPPAFGAPTTLNGIAPAQVAVADFDGDGKLDLAASNTGVGTVSVWRNTTANGVGTASFAAPISLAATGNPAGSWGIVAADFNSDGRADLALADGQRQITIWSNTSSTPGQNPTFAGPTGIPALFANPRFLTVGDFNKDNKLDVAFANYANGAGTQIGVALNTTPAGSFTPTFAGTTTITVPAGPAGIVAADLTGNGKIDLAFATATTLSILPNTTANGAETPTFAARIDLSLPAAGWSVAATDLNKDGKRDLVVGYNAGSVNLSVFRNTSANEAATPSFAARTDVGTGSSGYREHAVGDFNSDGRSDLVGRANGAALRVFANLSAANATTLSFSTPLSLTAANGAGGIAAADLNKDGKLDLIAPNGTQGTLSLFMNGTGPVPTATPTATRTPTATATATSIPTATATATATATPPPSSGATRDIGQVRVWADTFSVNGPQTTATGNVGIGSINADAPFYLIGTSAVWADSGPIALNGTLRTNGGTAFATGPFTVDRGNGALTGGQVTLTKLGASNLSLSNLTLTLNVLQPKALINATIALNLPENAGKTLALAFAIGPNDTLSTPNPAALTLKLAGGDLTANVQAAANGLTAASAQYTLPGLAALTLNNLLIDGKGELGLRFGNGPTFALPAIDLGFGVLLLSNLQGKLALSNNAYIINLTGSLSIDGLPESPVPIVPPVQNLRIAQGAVAGNVDDIALKVGGNPLLLKSVTIQRIGGGYRLVAATASFTWPAAWGTSTSDLQNVAILTTAPFLEIGGGTQTFTVPEGFPLGGPNATVKVRFDQITAQVSYLPAPQNTWGVDLNLRITFTFGNDKTVVEGVQFTLADGVASGAISNLTLKIAGLNLTLAELLYSNDVFTAGSATLALPSVWKGANINVNGVSISSSAVNLGSAGGIFPIPDQTLGKVIKLTGMSGKVNVGGDGSYSIAVTVGGIVFTIGSDTSTVNNTLFTISNGAVSALINTATVKVAGLGVTATNLAYTNGAFSVGSVNPAALGDPAIASLIPGTVTLALPGAWNGTKITIEGLNVTPDSFSLGGAGGTFPIPDQVLGKAIKLTGMTGKVNVNVATGAYTIGVNVGAVVFTAHTESSSASNVQFTIAGGAPSASIGSLTVKVAGLNVAASQVAYANGAFSAATAKITLPAAWKSLAVTVGGLKIDNNLFSIGAAGSTFAIPDINLGSTGVLKLTQNKGALNVLANGQYQFSISSIVSINKVQTSGGGNNLTVAGTLKIANGVVSGSISALAFKVSGVDFNASNMQFVGDKLTVAQAKLALSIAGKKTEATIYGLEIGGSVGFKFQGAQVLLPDFTIGSVGIKGAMLKFVGLPDGSYIVEGSATFMFTQFSVKGSFKIGYSPVGGVALKSVSLAFTGSLPSPAIPLGNTGFAIVKISGSFEMDSGKTTIALGLGAASYAGVGSVSLLSLDASVTLTIKPTFSLKASAGAKVIGLQVASVDLYISADAFQLKGSVQVAIVKASLEIAFGKDASGQFTFYGKARVEIVIPRGYICGDDDWWCPTFPTEDYNIGAATLEGGKFKKNSSVIWGARGSVTFFGFGVYAWAQFAPGPTDFGLGDKLTSYAPVKPVGVSIAAGGDPYQVTVTEAAEYLMVLETVAPANRAVPQDLQIIAPNGMPFTKQLTYSEPDNSLRIYRLDFADPQAAVGQWNLIVPTGNIAGMIGAAPGPELESFSACAGDVCLAPDTTTELDNGETLDVTWVATAAAADTTLNIYAENANGMRYPIAQQETTTGEALSGTKQWTLGLPSGNYTVVAEVESDGFAPLQVAQGTILINDTTPPAAPTGLTAGAAVDMSATATWNGAAAEPDVAGYQFTINGGDPIAVDGRLADYSTYGLAPGATHTISVAAYDYSGNLGAAATVTVTTPDFGVAAAWPLRDSANGAVTEIGASFTGPVTLGGFTLTDAQGKPVAGTLTPFIAEVSEGPNQTLGAAFVPAQGGLPVGEYTATITAVNPATGATISHTWSFSAQVDATTGATGTTIYLPLVRR